MNNEEIQSLINQLKATGLSDEQIMDVFYEAFSSGEMDRADLEALAESMGYELTDNFKNEPAQDPINTPTEENKTPENLEEQAQEFKENIDDKGEGEKAFEELKNPGSTASEEQEGKPEEKNEGEKEKPEDEGKSEEDEWEEAQRRLKW